MSKDLILIDLKELWSDPQLNLAFPDLCTEIEKRGLVFLALNLRDAVRMHSFFQILTWESVLGF